MPMAKPTLQEVAVKQFNHEECKTEIILKNLYDIDMPEPPVYITAFIYHNNDLLEELYNFCHGLLSKTCEFINGYINGKSAGTNSPNYTNDDALDALVKDRRMAIEKYEKKRYGYLLEEYKPKMIVFIDKVFDQMLALGKTEMPYLLGTKQLLVSKIVLLAGQITNAIACKFFAQTRGVDAELVLCEPEYKIFEQYDTLVDAEKFIADQKNYYLLGYCVHLRAMKAMKLGSGQRIPKEYHKAVNAYLASAFYPRNPNTQQIYERNEEMGNIINFTVSTENFQFVGIRTQKNSSHV
jgi:hypothetical protein